MNCIWERTVIKTWYTDSVLVRQLAAEFPDAVEAAATLHDFGLTICNRRQEFEELCTKDFFLSGHELGDGYFAVFHRFDPALPETPSPDPVPAFNPGPRRLRGEWWRRSVAFHRHAGRYGWPMWYCINGPLERFLKENFGTHCPWYLSDSQYVEAWRAVAWGPPQNS